MRESVIDATLKSPVKPSPQFITRIIIVAAIPVALATIRADLLLTADAHEALSLVPVSRLYDAAIHDQPSLLLCAG